MTQHGEPDDIDALLRNLDHEPPRVTVNDVVTRAAQTARPRRFALSMKAAGILLALSVAGAAYAIPGSPVRGWVRALVARIRGPETTPPAARTPAVGPASAGIAVTPGNALVIRFAARQASGALRVTLTDNPDVSVTAHDGTASFTAGVERLDVNNRGSSASFDLRIPRTAALIHVEIDGVRVFSKRGPIIDATVAADAGGGYVIDLK